MNIVKSITSDNNTSEEATINSLKLSMQWESINWFKVEKEVSKLQSRIVKATIKK